ncbi:hypothetical protein ACFQLX_12015 [Streptomyces polyrhachis]|uniref:Integral membrane protein n=1 Tax=Streptomyces polyrhachis TaxID=1282885 RepID=A0ABW2GFM6_9ACTN
MRNESAGHRPGVLPGLLAGAGAALVGALLLGPLQGSSGHRVLELGYFALLLGVTVGAVLGRASGAAARSRRVALLAVPLALLGVLLTQWLASAAYTGSWQEALPFWRQTLLGGNDVTFFAVAAVEAYLVAKRVSQGM